jgi:hypothetical protein
MSNKPNIGLGAAANEIHSNLPDQLQNAKNSGIMNAGPHDTIMQHNCFLFYRLHSEAWADNFVNALASCSTIHLLTTRMSKL